MNKTSSKVPTAPRWRPYHISTVRAPRSPPRKRGSHFPASWAAGVTLAPLFFLPMVGSSAQGWVEGVGVELGWASFPMVPSCRPNPGTGAPWLAGAPHSWRWHPMMLGMRPHSARCCRAQPDPTLCPPSKGRGSVCDGRTSWWPGFLQEVSPWFPSDSCVFIWAPSHGHGTPV